MVYCFVQFCPFAKPALRFGAERKRGEKVTFFKCPPEMGPEMFEEWYQHLPRPGFTKNSNVCERHFLECEIYREHVTYLKNGNVRRVKLDIPYLSPVAVPRIFPDPPRRQITKPPKQTTPVVSSTKPSSTKTVSYNSTLPNGSIKSTSNTVCNSFTVAVPRVADTVSKSASVVLPRISDTFSPPNPPSSSAKMIRRSLRLKNRQSGLKV